MLLRIGLALSAIAAVLAAITIVVVASRDTPEVSKAPAETTANKPLVLKRSYRERPKKPPVAEKKQPVAAAQEKTPLPADNPAWPKPQKGELQETRRFAPDPGSAMTLTLAPIGIYDAPIFDSDSAVALEAGVAHVPETSMPWDEGRQKNVYLAAHRLGYPGTGSRLLFYQLGMLERGDEVIIKGRGETYRYRVVEKLMVDPSDRWVMGQVRNRNMVTLQTCAPIPTFEKRLVIRADRVR